MPFPCTGAAVAVLRLAGLIIPSAALNHFLAVTYYLCLLGFDCVNVSKERGISAQHRARTSNAKRVIKAEPPLFSLLKVRIDNARTCDEPAKQIAVNYPVSSRISSHYVGLRIDCIRPSICATWDVDGSALTVDY